MKFSEGGLNRPVDAGQYEKIMSTTHAQQPEEARHISLRESWEIDYWCEKFQCSEPELKEAVKVAGDSVAALKHYFEENRLMEE